MLRGQWLDCAFRRFASLLFFLLRFLARRCRQSSGAHSRRENNFAHSLSEQQAKRRSERAVLG
jgi:hypothetical protein